ncbi:hypothetical protein IVG45_14150 [Methylomonas sp. LL1]|uniref:hypothetical protein n=1 Tax=Methylomonas sp. LL1 TaxID=2785785 RepID=UPI0018C4080A|nr:hypothetical protein [Methylomonas sp. LL1]QPK65709.1 hypothetical protein IVG45_14150 [Methylomonas sp. LL1]
MQKLPAANNFFGFFKKNFTENDSPLTPALTAFAANIVVIEQHLVQIRDGQRVAKPFLAG